MSNLTGQPIIILKEGASRTRGKEAKRSNITAAKIIAEVVKSTLGPRGMDKMLVDSLGDVTITNDGATILDEIDVQNPAAKMMVEIAKTQDDEVGDGTTTAVVLAGELLKNAEELIDNNIHVTTIISGYKKAADQTMIILDEISKPVDLDDKVTLKKAAMTALHSKNIGGAREHFAEIAVDSMKQVTEQRGERLMADVDNVQLVKKIGKSVLDTQLIKGIIIDKEIVHPGMPKSIKSPQIALLNVALEVEKTEFSAEIRISDPDQMQAFLDEETNILKEMVDKVKSSGANVLLCQKGIDDVAQHFLAKEEIAAIRRVSEKDIEKLSKATGGKIVTNIDDLKSEYLGKADLFEERKISDDKMTFIEGCKNPKAVAIIIRGGTERIVNEAERSIHDALCVVRDVIREPRIVAGGGAPELEVASKLRRFAEKLTGKEQLAVICYAEALEVIPMTLAENGGLDPIDILVELRAMHEKGEKWAGVDVNKEKAMDMTKSNVYEPLAVKSQVVKSASEAASMILRIDDVISASKPKDTPPGPPGGDSSEFD